MAMLSPRLHKRQDLRMDRHNTTLASRCFDAALKRLLLKVNLFRLHVQQFHQAESCVKEHQHGIRLVSGTGGAVVS